jgi:phosphatidylethanolamine/phosphatidyl-N-methylethanolamine N-methyltransferase
MGRRLRRREGSRLRVSHNLHCNRLPSGLGATGKIRGSGILIFYGIDITPQMVDLARAKAQSRGIGNVEFAIGDAYQLPFSDGMFDAVVISNALHVMIEPERALAEARRVLKEDGRLIVPTFCHGDNYLSKLVCRAMNLVGFKAFQIWSVESFGCFIEAHGYEVLRKEVFRDIIPLTYLVAQKGCKTMVEFT